MFYFSGINFGQGKLLVITSLLKMGLILSGIFYLIKTRRYELVLPVFALLISISLINTQVIQGDVINREILHRIAPVVPFVALFIGFGIHFFTQRFTISNKRLLVNICLFLYILIETMFIKQYFAGPYALDYNDTEFYINAHTIFTHSPPIPLSTFEMKNNRCVMKTITAGTFLRNEYRPYKTSAFPTGLKELMTVIWIIPLVTGLWPMKLMKLVFK